MKTILIVEDDNLIQQNVAEILGLASYNVLVANNGKEGIEAVRKHTPDLIVSDIKMPVVDGFGLLYMVRHDPATESIPFIFMTAKNERVDFRNAMDSGADDFISKPFTNDDLLKAVANRMNRFDIQTRRRDTGMPPVNEQSPSALHDNALETLFADKESYVCQKKHIIYKENSIPRCLYYILKGKVKTYKYHDDGRQLVLELYTSGDFLGHVALLDDSPYKETAETMEETELIHIPRKEFEDMVHKNISVANKLIKMLAKTVTEYEKHLLGAAYNTLRQKVAEALINMQKKYKANTAAPFHIDILRDDLAAMAGTATASLVRTLREFRDEKLINIAKDNSIEIINSKKLENLLR